MESGLPGRPKTSVASRRPNQSGLPGLSRTRQKTSSTPRGLQRRLDVVVRADRHAAGDEQHVAGERRPRRRRAVASRVVRDDRVDDDLGARRAREQVERQPVGLVDPARLGRRADLEQLGARREHVHDRPPVHRDRADAGGRERGHALHAERRARGSEHGAARDVLAAVAHVGAGARAARRA